MSCEYSKYINMLLDGTLDEKKKDELKDHSIQCRECSERINKINQIDNLVKDALVNYPFNSNKLEIMDKVKKEKNRTLFWKNIYYFRKPICALAAVVIIGLSFTYIKPILNTVIFRVQSVSESKVDISSGRFPIKVDNIQNIFMPGEDYMHGCVINMPCMAPGESAALWDNMYKQTVEYDIKPWVEYINSYTKLCKSTQSEINSIGYKEISPVTLTTKNGEYIHLYPMIKNTEIKQTVQGKLTVKIPYMDRYIIGFESQGGIKYYTVFSKSPLVHRPSGKQTGGLYDICLLNKVDSEGNISEGFLHGTDLLKNNDKMIISGIFSKGDSADVYIKDGSLCSACKVPSGYETTPTEIYKIAHIDSIEGEWSLEKSISYSMSTNDGKQFTLGNKIYYYEIDEPTSGGGGLLADLTKR